MTEVEPPAAGDPDPADLAQRLRAIRDETARERYLRAAAERTSAERPSVQAALLAAERDRDTLTSDRVLALRERATGLADRLSTAFTRTDHLRLLHGRLLRASHLPDLGEPGARLAALFAEEAQIRRRLTADLTTAGVEWFTVPAGLETGPQPGAADGTR
ncbi:hypothetical protein ACFFX1_10545 [Dactylosporangium sucinum]|uniref:Uncharacterized protein n=1 Tax=Dactylosporangium sucinum TaxID=1424081 RepID=A0A917WRV4_9ACTN|nr:hypothetical protein [Dactylosporangium sucinum]GGM23434.1 hypothetical protein GCM10007977_025800 [Dactylosporangium sucinum]